MAKATRKRNVSQPINEDDPNDYGVKPAMPMADFGNDRDFINEISENIRSWVDFNNINITSSVNDKYFVYVNQWNQNQISLLHLAKKPILQSNKIYDTINKMIGEYRVNGGELVAVSESHDSTEQEVELNNDFLRTLYFNSKNRLAYDQAYSDMVSGGFGVYGIDTEYEALNSPYKMPRLYAIKDPENCFFDPNCRSPFRDDGLWCGRYVYYSRKEFHRKYPDVPYPSSFPQMNVVGNFSWGARDQITVVEYYYKQPYEYPLYILNTGDVLNDDEFKRFKEINKQIQDSQGQAFDDAGNQMSFYNEMGSRVHLQEKVVKEKFKIIKIEAIFSQILKEEDFPSSELPLVFCPGPSVINNNTEQFMSVTRFAKDAQIMHNYAMVEMAHAIESMRKEGFIATEANIARFRDMWANPSNYQGALIADPDPITGAMPIQLAQGEISQSLMAIYTQTEISLQNILGYFEANRGKDSVEKSGIALKQQQMAGALSAAIYKDNMNMAIAQGGNVLMSMRKYLFDNKRTLNLLDKNKNTKKVTVNIPMGSGYYDDKETQNSLSKGDYKVIFEAGPSHMVQQQQMIEFSLQMANLSGNPPIMLDKIAEMAEMPPSVVERLKSLVPPDVLAKEEGRPPPQQGPNPQIMLAQQEMQLKEKSLQLDFSKLQMEFQKLQLQFNKLSSDEKTTAIKAQAEVRKAALDHNSNLVDATAKMVASHNDVRKEAHKSYTGNKNDRRQSRNTKYQSGRA